MWASSNNGIEMVNRMALLLVAVCLLAAMKPQAALSDEVGQRLYQNYCATCHGEAADGKGRGGMTGPRLTDLANRNGGAFPFDDVVSIIEGNDESRAHGSAMPAWGSKFDRLFGYGPEETRNEGEAWIRSLARYVGELQE